MSFSLIFLILFSALATAVISGVLGMVGGMILMGVYASLLSVTTAMILHGITQLASNGSRMILYWKHITWRPVGFYLAGSLVSIALFVSVALVPDKPVVFIILGIMPFIAAIPRLPALDIRRSPHAVLCGVLVTAAQLTGGATGPMLDIFYGRVSMTRYQIMGTKGVTQSIGHFQKIMYFALIAAADQRAGFDLPLWIIPLCILMAVSGSALGKRVVERLTDGQFLRYSQRVMLVVGGVYLVRGLFGLCVQP